jgi:hypothetical protein
LNQRYSLFLHEELDELSKSFTITDPSISGNPIVFVSRGNLKMSGYSKEELTSKNGKVFQGRRTNRRLVMEIRLVFWQVMKFHPNYSLSLSLSLSLTFLANLSVSRFIFRESYREKV